MRFLRNPNRTKDKCGGRDRCDGVFLPNLRTPIRVFSVTAEEVETTDASCDQSQQPLGMRAGMLA